MDSLLIRIVASAAVDVSLAVLCGLLLARYWLGATRSAAPSGWLPAFTLCTGGALQLLSLAAAFTGKPGVWSLCVVLPDIVRTHAGAVLGLALGASLLLLAVTFARVRNVEAAALLLCLVFRAGAGHAATERIVSLPQTMQLLHLAAMSVWSGTVLVGGLIVLPRLVAREAFPHYLKALSRAATWALAAVLLSGGYRGYTGLEGDLRALRHTGWGLVLVAKLAAVAAALGLGAMNRLALTRSQEWLPVRRRRTAGVLRAEAYAMLVILALSATLANLPPPGD